MRVAAVDLGTNSTRLLVADVAGRRASTRSCGGTAITRLGEGVDARRRLLPVPIARVRNVLADFRREAATLGAERVLAVATSAVRDAENGEAFLGEIEWSYGFATRLLSGDEEAELTLRGVATGRPLRRDARARRRRRLDGAGRRRRCASRLDVGSVRLTERLLHSTRRRRRARRGRGGGPRAAAAGACDQLVGVAGTVTTLARDRARRLRPGARARAPARPRGGRGAGRAARVAAGRRAAAACRGSSRSGRR